MSNSFWTLHRYFIWADRMRVHFEAVFKKDSNVSKKEELKIEMLMYMSLWYGMMHVVIEGWEKLGFHDKTIDDLLSNQKNKDLLLKYRHSVFHFHENYIDCKMQRFFEEKTTVEWIRNLHQAFSEWFLNNIDYHKRIL